LNQIPPKWSEDRLADDADESMRRFREVRIQEPLEAYLDYFDEYRQHVETLIEGTVDLTELRNQAVDLLTRPEQLTAIRYLASPAISADDLTVLADAALSAKRLRAEPEMARRVIETVLLGLDRERFPWVAEDREPTETERAVAVISTAALIATQKVQTDRRNKAKDDQERAVADALLANGFTQVPKRHVENVGDFPQPGEFCDESYFGTRKADLIVRLWDGRIMAIECKVSNSSTNSVKRLNNDAAAKAKTWIQQFGTATCIPVTVLSRVFKVHNLESAKLDGLTLFWAHRLQAMIDYIAATKS
jgi:hypothetical protein